MTSYLSIRLPQVHETLLPALEQAFLHAIALAVVEALPDSKLSEFEHTLASGNERDVVSFIEANVPHARERLRNVADEFLEPFALS